MCKCMVGNILTINADNYVNFTIFVPNVIDTVIISIGGSPYPDTNAGLIANKIQEGYRMPKPRHVDSKL